MCRRLDKARPHACEHPTSDGHPEKERNCGGSRRGKVEASLPHKATGAAAVVQLQGGCGEGEGAVITN